MKMEFVLGKDAATDEIELLVIQNAIKILEFASPLGDAADVAMALSLAAVIFDKSNAGNSLADFLHAIAMVYRYCENNIELVPISKPHPTQQ